MVSMKGAGVAFNMCRSGGLIAAFQVASQAVHASSRCNARVLTVLRGGRVSHQGIKNTVVTDIIPGIVRTLVNTIIHCLRARPLVINDKVGANVGVASRGPGRVKPSEVISMITTCRGCNNPILILSFKATAACSLIARSKEFNINVATPNVQVSTGTL